MKTFMNKRIDLIFLLALFIFFSGYSNLYAESSIKRLTIIPDIPAEQWENNDLIAQYNRSIGMISKQLIQSGFEVVSVFSLRIQDPESFKTLIGGEKTELCRHMTVDALLYVNLDIKVQEPSPGIFTAAARLDISGVSCTGTDLGITRSDDLKYTDRDQDNAVRKATVELSINIGRRTAPDLAAFKDISKENNPEKPQKDAGFE